MIILTNFDRGSLYNVSRGCYYSDIASNSSTIGVDHTKLGDNTNLLLFSTNSHSLLISFGYRMISPPLARYIYLLT